MKDLTPPPAAPGERFWFALYFPASWTYRVFLSVAILTFIAGRYFFLGVIQALWPVLGMLILPLAGEVKGLWHNPALGERRGRAALVIGGLTAGILLLLFFPLPLTTQTEGVVWIPEDPLVRAGTEGFVAAVLAHPASRVIKGQRLLLLEDPPA